MRSKDNIADVNINPFVKPMSKKRNYLLSKRDVVSRVPACHLVRPSGRRRDGRGRFSNRITACAMRTERQNWQYKPGDIVMSAVTVGSMSARFSVPLRGTHAMRFLMREAALIERKPFTGLTES